MKSRKGSKSHKVTGQILADSFPHCSDLSKTHFQASVCRCITGMIQRPLSLTLSWGLWRCFHYTQFVKWKAISRLHDGDFVCFSFSIFYPLHKYLLSLTLYQALNLGCIQMNKTTNTVVWTKQSLCPYGVVDFLVETKNRQNVWWW